MAKYVAGSYLHQALLCLLIGLAAPAQDLVSKKAESQHVRQPLLYNNVLQAASGKGHQEILKLAEDQEANMNGEGGEHSNVH
jgi:hypothetical protein